MPPWEFDAVRRNLLRGEGHLGYQGDEGHTLGCFALGQQNGEHDMKSLTRLGAVLVMAAALGIPSTASAFSLSDWLRDILRQISQHRNDRPHWPHKPGKPRHDRAVPEPTAALLFGLGTVVVAARTRKPR
jgi:hypothetical protein